MHILGSSSMSFSSFAFQLLCIILCIVTVTSYRIDHRPSFEDRNERAVTEWRFRRNYLFRFPYFFQTPAKNNHLVNNAAHDKTQSDEIKSNEKKYIIPETIYARMNN